MGTATALKCRSPLSIDRQTVEAQPQDGGSVSSPVRENATPPLRDLRSSSLMRRRSKQSKGPSDQVLSAAVATPQQVSAKTGKATPATSSAEAAVASAQTSLGHGLQPRPPPEDALRPLKERPRPWRRGWNPLA